MKNKKCNRLTFTSRRTGANDITYLYIKSEQMISTEIVIATSAISNLENAMTRIKGISTTPSILFMSDTANR